MLDTDLAFEKSDVEAVVVTKIESVKNPLSGRIQAPEIGELIMDDENAKGEVLVNECGKHSGGCKLCSCA